MQISNKKYKTKRKVIFYLNLYQMTYSNKIIRKNINFKFNLKNQINSN